MNENLFDNPELLATILNSMTPDELEEIRRAADAIPGVSSLLRCHLAKIRKGVLASWTTQRNAIAQNRSWFPAFPRLLGTTAIVRLWLLFLKVTSPLDICAGLKIRALNNIKAYVAA